MDKTIAITGINAVDSPGPGVAVARSLTAHYGQNISLIGLAYDAIDPGLFDPELFRDGYLLPYPVIGKDALLNRLKEIHSKNKIDVIIPTLDSEMLNFSEIEPDLKEMGIKMFIPSPEQITARSKINLTSLASEYGFNVPRTAVVHDYQNLEHSAQWIGFPLFVKGIYYEAYKCHNLDQVYAFANLIAGRWGFPLLLQENLGGEEFNAAAIGDGKGATVSALCMKKILYTDKGKGWAGVSIKNKALLELTGKFISAVKWRGALEMETLLAHRDGKLYIIEINPRFPAWIYLSIAAGNNMPAMYVQLASGKQTKKTSEYKTGKVFIHYTIDLIGEISQLDALLTKNEIHY